MKRGAEEYITKENGTSLNPGAAGDDKPKMSTAAQQARRKIATPKSRLGRSTTPTQQPNPFAQSNTGGNGFSFGGQNASASFPPAQPSQQQSFEFSMPSTSSSFTFGSNTNSSFSNPFANMNGIAQSNTNNDRDAMQESPQKKPFSFGGSTNSAATTNGFGGFQFGQQAQEEAPKATFGAQPQTNGVGGLFGQSSTASAPTFGGFGNSSASTSAPSAPTLFGQSTSTPQSQAPPSPSVFGQASSAQAFAGFGGTAPAPASSFKFGETTIVNDEKKENETPKPKSLFSFGQPAQKESVPATEPPKFSFGQPAAQQTPSKSLFGQPPAEPVSEPPKGLFSFPPTAPPPSTSNMFGAPKSASPSVDLFARASPAADAQSTASDEQSNTTPQPQAADESNQPKNPFASLFGAKPASDSSNQPVAKPKFAFGETSSSSFPKPIESPSKPADPFTFKPLAPAQTIESTPANATGSLSTSTATPSSLFNFKPATITSAIESPTKPTASSLFAAKPNMNADAGSTPFKGFGSQPDTSKRNNDISEEQPAKKKLFQGTSTPDTMAKSAGLSRAPPVQAPSTLPPSTSQAREGPLESINRPVFSEGPPQIPRHLDADKYKAYDLMWRLKALNRRFQEVVASCDTDQYDLLNIVQNYLDHRESLGAGGLSQYHRAGTKRKTADVDDMQDDPEQNKKSKPTTPSSNNLFGAVPSPKPAATSTPRPSDSSTSNLFKSMIPGASQTTVGALQMIPTNANKSTTPPSSPPKPSAPKFEVPKFGALNGAGFANAFAQSAAANAKKAEAEEKAKRKAEEFDSDDDDEAEWNKKYEEEQRAKKAKIEAAMKKNLFVPSASSSRSNSPFSFAQPVQSIEQDTHTTGNSHNNAINMVSDEETSQNTASGSGSSGEDETEATRESDEDGDDEEEEPNEEGLPIPEIAPENSLFSRISKDASKSTESPIMQPAANNSFKPGIMFGNIGKSTPDAPVFTPVTPAGPKGDFVPAKTFNFTPTPANSTPAFGSLKEGPIPGEGLFGSRPSTPQPPSTAEKVNPFAGAFGTVKPSGTDNTWTKGSPIRFNGDKSDDTPTVEVTAATPPAKETTKPFAGLFGEATSSAVKNPPISNGTFTGFNFGQKPVASSNTTAPGFLSAASHLGGVSADTSRATSPGLLSEAESVATDNTEDYSNDPQASLMSSAAGEEEEDAIWESKAILSRNIKKGQVPEKTKFKEGWNKIGTGSVKVLKHKQTGKTRIVFRVDPGANILLNTRLIPGAKYAASASGNAGSVSIPCSTDKGLEMYALKVKTKENADKIAELLEANKKN